MESALYDFYSLVEAYQKTHSFAALTRSFSDTSQLVNKKPYARTFHEVNRGFEGPQSSGTRTIKFQ